MLKHTFTLLLLFFCTINFAQEIIVTGKVVDVEGDPVPGVKVYFSQSPKKFVYTSRKGEYNIELDKARPDTLKFRTVRFDPAKHIISKRMIKKASKTGVIEVDIILPDKTLKVFELWEDNKPDTIIDPEEWSVEDYEFVDNQLVLLTYEKTLKKGAVLRLIGEDKEEIDKYYIPGVAIELKRDYRDNIHLLAEERVYLVTVKDSSIHVLLEDRDYYFKYVAPILDTIGDNIYFSNYSDVYPAFDYYEFNIKDSTYNVILELEDTFMMEFYRAEYKYVDVQTKLWAHQKQIETGIDKEIWVGATVFTNSIYYTPIYAPLFKTGEDSIVVFDHYKNRMFRYTPDEGFIDSTRISYHLQERKSGWEQPLIQDEVNGKVYALFLKGGYSYLSEIDKINGNVKKSFKLYFKYVDRIRIIDGNVYYVYRPYESVQKKFIYREKLKIG